MGWTYFFLLDQPHKYDYNSTLPYLIFDICGCLISEIDEILVINVFFKIIKKKKTTIGQHYPSRPEKEVGLYWVVRFI